MRRSKDTAPPAQPAATDSAVGEQGRRGIPWGRLCGWAVVGFLAGVLGILVVSAFGILLGGGAERWIVLAFGGIGALLGAGVALLAPPRWEARNRQDPPGLGGS